MVHTRGNVAKHVFGALGGLGEADLRTLNRWQRQGGSDGAADIDMDYKDEAGKSPRGAASGQRLAGVLLEGVSRGPATVQEGAMVNFAKEYPGDEEDGKAVNRRNFVQRLQSQFAGLTRREAAEKVVRVRKLFSPRHGESLGMSVDALNELLEGLVEACAEG